MLQLFGSLREYLALIADFSAIEAPITSDEGLRAYLTWLLRAATVFGMPEQYVALAQKAVNDQEAFALLLAAVQFVHAHVPKGETFASAATPSQEELVFASQLSVFVSETQRAFSPV
jgi:hypothetical protein